jgi:glycosyltransferase involved in cell wall biosynthesis
MKICIIGLDDYPQLAGHEDIQFVGGESVQHVLLAQAWRDLGLDVSMIVRDHGQGRVSTVNGIRAIAAFKREDGIPVLRFAHPRLTGLIGAMHEADADVYYQSPSAAATGFTAWFCRRFGKRSLIRIASDLGCIPGKQLIRYWRDRRIYEYGLRHADIIVAQTEHQRALLKQHYGLPSEVINMIAEIPPLPTVPQDIDVLWVANLRPVKRPEILFELALRAPHLKFVLAGGALPGTESYYETMMSEASKLPNLVVLGAVPYAQVGELFDRARLCVNTSSMEGFPNTFLQAWARAVPVVSFFDPDSLIKRLNLGRAVTTTDDMSRAIDELIREEGLRRAMGQRAREFCVGQFSASQVANRYLELLRSEPAEQLRFGTAG